MSKSGLTTKNNRFKFATLPYANLSQENWTILVLFYGKANQHIVKIENYSIVLDKGKMDKSIDDKKTGKNKVITKTQEPKHNHN